MAAIDATTFRLADGVDEGDFLDADEHVRTGFLYQQPGIVRATTAKADDGQWILLVVWASEEDADAANQQAETDPAVQRFRQLTAGAERNRYRDFG
jgi:hypothetical protein